MNPTTRTATLIQIYIYAKREVASYERQLAAEEAYLREAEAVHEQFAEQIRLLTEMLPESEDRDFRITEVRNGAALSPTVRRCARSVSELADWVKQAREEMNRACVALATHTAGLSTDTVTP
jgi:hypothetical protein